MRYSPDVFWAMSMKEWVAAVNGYFESKGVTAADVPMTRDELMDLMEEYPDVGNTA